MPDVDYQRHRIYVEAIRIRVKSPDLNYTNERTRYPTWLSISFKVDNEIREERTNWMWGDLDWTFQSPVELCANNKASVEIRPGLSARTDTEVLAAATFEDIIASTRSLTQSSADFQQEHQLAIITIRFRSQTPERYEDVRQDVRRRDSLKTRVRGYLERPFKRNERHDAPLEYWTGANPNSTLSMARFSTDWRDPSALYLSGQAAAMPEVSRPWQDPVRQVSPQVRLDPEPSDTGKIEYTVVGTTRPKPR